MTIKGKVGPKGEIVIAEELRAKLGIDPSWLAYQFLVDGHVEIHCLPPEHGTSLAGSAAQYTKKSIALGKEWDEARETAWKQRAEEKMNLRERE